VQLVKAHDDDFGFCEKWLTAGCVVGLDSLEWTHTDNFLFSYAMQLSIVFGGMGLLSLIIVLFGGRKKRERGWPVCAGFIALHGMSSWLPFDFAFFLS
jgi:hypothetical protein